MRSSEAFPNDCNSDVTPTAALELVNIPAKSCCSSTLLSSPILLTTAATFNSVCFFRSIAVPNFVSA